MWHFIFTFGLAVGASATFSSSGYVNNVFELLKVRLAANGSVNWALPGANIELQRTDDNLSISFFRAYYQGLEHLELEDECSMRNVSQIINIECLAKFPNAIFTAYGNLRYCKDGATGGLIRVHVTTNNLFFLLRIDQMADRKVISFDQVSPPEFDVTIAPKLVPVSWEDPVKTEISKWSYGKFMGFLNADIKMLLEDIVASTPFVH